MADRRTCPARRDEGSPRESERFMNIFSKARAGLNLTPAERALVKLVQGWIIAGLISAAVTFITAVSHPRPDWANVLRVSAGAFAVAALIAAHKYSTAHLDPPLAAAVDAAAPRLGVSDYGNKPAPASYKPPLFPQTPVTSATPADVTLTTNLPTH